MENGIISIIIILAVSYIESRLPKKKRNLLILTEASIVFMLIYKDLTYLGYPFGVYIITYLFDLMKPQTIKEEN